MRAKARASILFAIIALALNMAAITSPAFADPDPDIGTGVLYVYTDVSLSTLAPYADGTYYVVIGETYYIRIKGITEFDTDDLLTIKIGWTDTDDTSQTTFINDVPVRLTGDIRYVDVTWTVPSDAKVCTNSTVHYRNENKEYVVSRQTSMIPAHMHIVPEIPLGTIGSVLALFTGLGAFLLKKSNKAVLGHP